VKIIIDTREQRPYKFKTTSKVGTIPIGDYSICGLEHLISVERKEINDLALDYFCLVIEGSLSDLTNGRYRSKMLPNSAIQSLMAFSVRYRLPIFFCENRKYGARVTESLLLKYAREIEKHFKKITT